MPLSTTLQFVNGTFAVLTLVNGGHYKYFAGQKNTIEMHKTALRILKDWWNIHDYASGMAMVERLREGEHNPIFINEVAFPYYRMRSSMKNVPC